MVGNIYLTDFFLEGRFLKYILRRYHCQLFIPSVQIRNPGDDLPQLRQNLQTGEAQPSLHRLPYRHQLLLPVSGLRRRGAEVQQSVYPLPQHHQWEGQIRAEAWYPALFSDLSCLVVLVLLSPGLVWTPVGGKVGRDSHSSRQNWSDHVEHQELQGLWGSQR